MFFLDLFLKAKKIVSEILHIRAFLKKHRKLAHRLYLTVSATAIVSFFCLVFFAKNLHDYIVFLRPSENLISNTLNYCGNGSMITWISISEKPGAPVKLIFKSANSCVCAKVTCKKDCVKNAADVNLSLYALERVVDKATVDFFKKNRVLSLEIKDGEFYNSGFRIELPYLVRQLLSLTIEPVQTIKIYSVTDKFGRLSNIFTFSFFGNASRNCSGDYVDGVLRTLASELKGVM